MLALQAERSERIRNLLERHAREIEAFDAESLRLGFSGMALGGLPPPAPPPQPLPRPSRPVPRSGSHWTHGPPDARRQPPLLAPPAAAAFAGGGGPLPRHSPQPPRRGGGGGEGAAPPHLLNGAQFPYS